MIYLSSARKKKESQNRFFLKSGFIVLIAIFVSAIFYFIYNPINSLKLSVRQSFFSMPFLDIFTTKHFLQEENNKLKQEVISLQTMLSEYKLINQENNSDTENSKGFLNAYILGNPGYTPYDILFIDKGSLDGVLSGDHVLFSSTTIGFISKVSDKFSQVELLTTNDKLSKARLSISRVPIELKGIGGGVYESYVPIAVNVSVGEGVIFQDNKSIAGKVERIIEKESDTLKRLIVRPLVNPFEIENVIVSHSIIK